MNYLRIFAVVLAVSQVSAQDVQRCTKTASTESPGEVEFHCSCMEQLIKMDEPVYKLTVNQTDCESIVLKLNWSSLQSYIGVKKVVFDRASILFDVSGSVPANSSVKELNFFNSVLKTISINAFRNLKMLETLRIVSCRINVIQSNAFTGLYRLKTVEFANTSIAVIEEDAFTDLPLLHELAFIKSKIDVLEKNAIHIWNPPDQPKQECPTDIEGRMRASRFMNEVTARHLNHLQNVTLPQYGSKLLFFITDIQELKHLSINTNAFAYIIFGGNIIESIERKALAAVIHNECDISAFLLISNYIKLIESEAFVNVTGSEKEPHNTVIAISDNTFYEILPRGFLLDSKMETSFINENRFSCECEKFTWLLSNENSATQNRLERELIESGHCIENKDLLDFLNACAGGVYFPPTTTEITTIPSTSTTPVSSSTSCNSDIRIYSLTVLSLLLQIRFLS